jgi:hypothetical protein
VWVGVWVCVWVYKCEETEIDNRSIEAEKIRKMIGPKSGNVFKT